MKTTYSRKKIRDKFAGMTKADGSPMSRQQIHMLRKKARGVCLTCGEPALGVYCLRHTMMARNRMRVRLKQQQRLEKSRSYLLEKKKGARNGTARGLPAHGTRPKVRAKTA
jgi:hypothetical protein